MAKLWELSDDLRHLESFIESIMDSEPDANEDGAKLDHLFEEWLTLDSEFEKKCEATACYIRRLESLTEARKQEAKRLRELAESSERQADKLKEYLVLFMTKHDKRKIDGVSAKLSLRKKPPKVELTVPVGGIPPEYQRVKVEPRLDEIKNLLKSGQKISWASFVDGDEYSLIIK